VRNLDDNRAADPTWVRDGRRLKALYFLFYGAGGLSATYFPYYFEAIGLSAASIGLVLGGKTLLGIVGQPPISALGDRWGRPRRLIASCFAVALLAAAILPFAAGFWMVAAAVWLSAPFIAAVIPIVDAMVVRHAGVGRYGRYRLWGSVGFGIVVAGFGVMLRDYTHGQAGAIAVHAYLGIAAVGVVAALSLRPRPSSPVENKRRARLVPTLPFAVFLAAHAVHWASIAIVNIYLSLHLKDAGLAVWVPGIAFGVSIIGEATAFAIAGRILRDEHALRWLVAIALVGIVRWLVTAAVPSAGVVILIQLTHFLTFGIWYSLAIRQLGRFTPPELRTTAQGAFAAACFGVGGLGGSVIGGAIMDHWGGAGTFLFAAGLEVVALVAFVFSQRLIPPPAPGGDAAG
jgi:PPP family 3-phenylpropionic acid transporter